MITLPWDPLQDSFQIYILKNQLKDPYNVNLSVHFELVLFFVLPLSSSHKWVRLRLHFVFLLQQLIAEQLHNIMMILNLQQYLQLQPVISLVIYYFLYWQLFIQLVGSNLLFRLQHEESPGLFYPNKPLRVPNFWY